MNSTQAIAASPPTSAAVQHDQHGQHAHHWRIDEANGPLSSGVCKICGIAKPFKNWLSDTDFITNTEHQVAA